MSSRNPVPSIALFALPPIAAEWRRLGHSFEGAVYFVYDITSPIGAHFAAVLLAGETALLRTDEVPMPTRTVAAATEKRGAGARICDAAIVAWVLAALEPATRATLTTHFAKPTPPETLTIVVFDKTGIALGHIPLPPVR